MFEVWLFVFDAFVATFLPLGLGLFVGIKFRNREAPTIWLIVLLLIMAVGSATLLIWIPSSPVLASILILAGTVICSVVAFASILRKIKGLSFSAALVIPVIAALPFILWTDLRFRLIVRDPDGRAVEFPRALTLHHPPEGYPQSYQTLEGLRLKKGTIYFGLIGWLRYKDRWKFPPELGFEDAGWSKWPKRMTVESQNP